MTDDLKQKADEAWDRPYGSGLQLRAAVEASLEAALAPVLERVARLEADNSHDAPDPEWERRWDPKLPTPCGTCGGARFVCDAGGEGRPCPQESHAYVLNYNRRPCPDCSKPAAGPEGETACTRHGQYRCPACAAGMVEEVPAATQGIPQSGPQAPERIEIFMSQSLGWQISRVGGGIAYVRADVHAKACIDSRRLGEEHVRLLDERGDFTEGSRLVSAERRIAEVPSPVPSNASMAAMAHDEDAPFPETVVHGKLDGRMRKYIPVDGTELQGQLDKARAEGREAGIREAAIEADAVPGGFAAGNRIRALLDKKPEVGYPEMDFDEWWQRVGRMLDSEPSVSWEDKRRDLAAEAWEAAKAQSGNYVCDTAVEPSKVTFANGRVVRIVGGATWHLDIGRIEIR